MLLYILGTVPKKIHPHRLSRENERKLEKVGVFWPLFENIFVPESLILLRTNNFNSPYNFTLENICPTFYYRDFRGDTLGLTNDKVDY